MLATKQLTPLEMNQIEVLAFGGATAIRQTTQTPFRRCVNYYSVNDPLLLVVPPAAQALRSGLIANNDEFVFLMPRLGDPIADHNLIGPTYAQALEWEGRRFQLHHRSLVYRILQPLWVAFLAFVLNALRQWNEWQRTLVQSIVQSTAAVQKLWIDKVWKPLVIWMKIVLQLMWQIQQNVKGGDKFVPASTVLNDNST